MRKKDDAGGKTKQCVSQISRLRGPHPTPRAVPLRRLRLRVMHKHERCLYTYSFVLLFVDKASYGWKE